MSQFCSVTSHTGVDPTLLQSRHLPYSGTFLLWRLKCSCFTLFFFAMTGHLSAVTSCPESGLGEQVVEARSWCGSPRPACLLDSADALRVVQALWIPAYCLIVLSQWVTVAVFQEPLRSWSDLAEVLVLLDLTAEINRVPLISYHLLSGPHGGSGCLFQHVNILVFYNKTHGTP